MAKILPWTRAIVLILSMLIAQFPLLDASAAPAPVDVAAPLGGSAPDAGEGELRLAASRPIGVPNGPARQDWDNECAIKVLAAAVTDPPAEPDHESPPSGTTNTEPFGATAIEDAGTRTQLPIWVVVMNWTGLEGCGANRSVHIDTVTVTVGGTTWNLTPDVTLDAQYDYWDWEGTYVIDAFSPNPIAIGMEADGTIDDNQPVHDEDKTWSVQLTSPGFDVLPFTAEPDTTEPGKYVEFELGIRNTRAGVGIDDLIFASEQLPAPQCDSIDDWRDADGEPLVLPLAKDGIAVCTITNVLMPPDSPSDRYTLAGTLTAKAGTAEAVVEVVSDPVLLQQPSIHVRKEVDRIIRGTEEVQEPAQPGDRIYYTITVENTSMGDIDLEQITIQDSLTGRVPGTAGLTLARGESETFDAVWTVLPNSQDPLTNIASVSALVAGMSKSVSADGAASVDIADSALRMSLEVQPATADVGDQVTYKLTLYNDGDKPIHELSYAALSGTLRSVGELPVLVSSLASSSVFERTWDYTIQAGDPDPLVNTVRVKGTVDGREPTAQAQAIVDVTNPDIGIAVTVEEPPTTTVLRGGEAVYAIEVENKGANAVCGVTVSQMRVDPDTGMETLLIPQIPMSWPTGTLGRLEGVSTEFNAATASTTYLVTSSDKNPLHMVFKVTAAPCDNGSILSDRTSRVLQISDVQVNAEIQAHVASTLVTSAKVGDTVNFKYLVTNVGTISLSHVSATYCLPSREDCSDPDNQHPLTFSGLDPSGTLFNFETATSTFTPSILTGEDAARGQFPVEVTLSATDNRNNDVKLKTSGVIDVTSEHFTLEVTGPTEAVVGDTHTYTFTLTNNTNTTMSGIDVVVQDDSGRVIGEDIEILGLDKTHSATFDYAIDAPPDATVFRLTLRAEGTTETDDLVATGSHDVVLIPLISVDKTGPGSVTPGDSVTYSVTITNNSIEQTFTVDPDGLHDDVLESTDYNISVTAADFDWPDADNILGPGQSATADLELPNVQGVVTPLVNTFTVTGTKGENEPIPPASDQHEIEVTCPIDFVAQVDVIPDGGFPILGNTLRWEIMLYNTTGVDLTGVQIYEEPLKWGGQVPDADITWPGGSGAIPPHGSVQLAAFEKPITNDYFSAHTETAFMTTTLRATFGEVAGVAECEEEISVPLFSPITVVKIPDTSIALTGDTVNYEFMLVNVSEDETYWVTLHDPLLSPDPIPMYYNGDSQPATESGHVSPGEIVTGPLRSYIVKASDPDKLINTATAQFPDPDDPETTFYTTGKAEVLTIAPLSLVKEASSDNASRGTRISYTYELTNNTEYPITNITLTDDQIKTLIPGDYLEPHGQAISLDPFDSKTFEVPYDIPVDAPHPLINTATANGTVHLPAGARDVSAEATLAVQLEEPDITIEKTIKDVETNEELPDDLPQTAQDGDGILEGEVGQRVKYCFTVTNNSDSPDSYVSDIVVEDEQLGAGVLQPLLLAEVAKLTPSRAPGMLFGQESVEFCYPPSGWLTLTREKGDPQTNTVTLRGVTPSGASTIPVYTEGSVTVDLIGTDLLITKSTSQPLAYIGQDVTYTLRIENRNQSREIIDIEVFDSFLGDVELDATGWDWSAAGGTPGTLNIGGYATFTYTYTIQPDDPDPLVNTASATGTLAVENTPVEDATQSALAITPSQLLVRKYPSISRALPEQEVSYTIAITNVGQVPVYGLSATDTRMNSLPAPSLTELWPNKTAYITYTMPMPTESELANEPDLDPFVNTVTVTGTINDANGIPLDEPVIGQATAMVDIVQPNISISKVPVTGAATPGGEAEYTITIRNTGGEGDTLTDLIFRDLTTGDEIDLDSVCPGSECSFDYGPEPYTDDNGTFVKNPLDGKPYDPVTNGPLLPGEMLIGTITVTVPPEEAGTEFTNTAEIEASAGAATVRDRSAATIDVRQEGISVTKRSDTTVAVIGQEITYTIEVENTGRVPFTRLRIIDEALPEPVDITDGFPDSGEGDTDTLDPGEVHPSAHTYTYTIQPEDEDPHTNRVTVSATTALGATIASSAQTTVDIQVAEVDVEKFVCAEDNPAGNTVPEPCTPVLNVADENPDIVTYYIRIGNPGIIGIDNISVNDPLAPSGTFDAANWPNSQNALEPGAEAWFKYNYTVTETDLDVFWNTVTVVGQSVTTPPQTAEDAASAPLRLVTGDLLLTKTAAPGTAQVGDEVTYTLTAQNLGTQNAEITGITIVDPLSGSTEALCTIDTLAPGATSAPCTFPHTVSLADPSPLVNQAFAEGTQVIDEEPITVRDTATHTLEIVTPGLSVSKTPSKQVVAFDEDVIFTYVIENTGQSQIANLSVTDSDPAITFNADWPQTLAAGQVAVRTATRTMTMQDPDPYTNTLTVTGTRGGLPVRAEASATVALSANEALAVSNLPDRQYVAAGGTVIFAYTARNLGTQPLTDVTFDDGGECFEAYVGAATLEPRGSVTVYCPVENVELPGPLVSTVRVSADTGSGVFSDTATAQVEVVSGDLLVTKSADRFVAQPGETITYTVTMKNVGTEALYNLKLFESMEIGLTPDLPETLLPGASVTLTGAYTVPNDNPPDSVANTVTVTGAGVSTQDDYYSDSASVSVAVVENPDAILALTKQATANIQAGALRARPGDTVTYVFTVRNFSNELAEDVRITDPALADNIIISALGPGETATFSRTAAIPGDYTETSFDNTATVSTDFSSEPVEQDTASASVPVQLVELTKTANIDFEEGVAPGDTVTYTFTIKSFTSASLDNVMLEDAGLTLAVPFPVTLAGNEEINDLSGTMTVPQEWGHPEFVNNATLTRGGEWLDDASVAVPVVSQEMELTIDSITQAYEGGRHGAPFRTGEAIEIAFTLRNISADTIVMPSVTANNPITDSAASVVCMTSQHSLAPEETLDGICLFTPEAGLESYLDPDGLEPVITLTASGTMISTDASAMADAEATLSLVDLALDVALTVMPNSAERGDDVRVEVTLTNSGASPIGCETQRGADPCWSVVFDALPAGWPDLNALFAQEITDLQSVVLQPETEHKLELTDPITVPAAALHTEFGVTVTGGSYNDQIADSDLGAYTVEETATAMLTIEYEGVVLALTEIRQSLEGEEVNGTEQRPVQTGKPATVHFTVYNDSDTALRDITYSISFAGEEYECAPPQAGATDPMPIASPQRTLTCVFTPPVAHDTYTAVNGLVKQRIDVLLTATGDDDQLIPASSGGSGDTQSLTTETTSLDEIYLVDLKLSVTVRLTKNDLPVTPQIPALPGETIKIHVMLKNEGTSPLGCPATVTDPALPCALTLDSIIDPIPQDLLTLPNIQLRSVELPSKGSYNVPPIEWTIPSGATLTKVAVTASGGTYGDAFADVSGLYSTYASGETELALGLPKLGVTIQATPLPPVFGQNITYMVTVTNQGLIPVTLQSGTYQIIPLTTTQAIDGIMLMSNGPRPQAQALSGPLTFTTTVLQPGQTSTATISKIEDQNGSYRFIATVNGVGLTQPVSVTSELTLTPLGSGTPTGPLDPNATEPQVSKEPSAPNAQPGGSVSWTVQVRNGSTGVMNGVVVTDTVPPTMTVTAAASTRGEATINGAQVSLPVGTLNPGETVTLTINTMLSPAVSAPATITNTACAARQGGPQVCDVGTVTLGPGVSSLPATGIRSSGGALGWRWDALLGIGFSGALMLFLSVQASQRRKLAAILFVLVALLAIGGAIVLVLTRGDDDTPDDEAQVPGAATQTDDATQADSATSASAPDAAASGAAGAPAEVAFPTPYAPPEPSGARTLLIPKLGESFPAPIPILEVPIINRQWDVSGLGYYIGWLDGTTWVETEWGNTVLAAHVQLDAQTPGPFWGLSELVPGDEIILREGDTERVYLVMSTRKVAPDDLSVVAPGEGPLLTLVTCTDWDNAYGVFAQRLIVQAIPVA